MPRLKSNTSMCSVARSLELIGERWTLLIIREAFFGTRRFDDFQANLGISRNVLAERLAKLVRAGILVQTPLHEQTLRNGYALTQAGYDLVPALVALLQWGDRWMQTPETVPVYIVERKTGRAIAPVTVRSETGKPLALKDLGWLPGPGAHHPSIAPLVKAYARQREQAATARKEAS